MLTYSMTIDGQTREVFIPEDMASGIILAMERVNETIPNDSDKWMDFSKYFESVLQGHGDDLQNIVDRALRSYNNTPEPTVDQDTPPNVVAVVTPVSFVTNYQAREALRQAGLFSTVNAAIKAFGEDSSEYQAWEYANNFYRESQLIVSMAGALGMDAAAVDALFVAAKQIQ